MFENKNNKKPESDIYESSKKSNNPFENAYVSSVKDIFRKISFETEKLNSKCFSNTYIWIEKFKEDDFE